MALPPDRKKWYDFDCPSCGALKTKRCTGDSICIKRVVLAEKVRGC